MKRAAPLSPFLSVVLCATLVIPNPAMALRAEHSESRLVQGGLEQTLSAGLEEDLAADVETALKLIEQLKGRYAPNSNMRRDLNDLSLGLESFRLSSSRRSETPGGEDRWKELEDRARADLGRLVGLKVEEKMPPELAGTFAELRKRYAPPKGRRPDHFKDFAERETAVRRAIDQAWRDAAARSPDGSGFSKETAQQFNAAIRQALEAGFLPVILQIDGLPYRDPAVAEAELQAAALVDRATFESARGLLKQEIDRVKEALREREDPWSRRYRATLSDVFRKALYPAYRQKGQEILRRARSAATLPPQTAAVPSKTGLEEEETTVGPLAVDPLIDYVLEQFERAYHASPEERISLQLVWPDGSSMSLLFNLNELVSGEAHQAIRKGIRRKMGSSESEAPPRWLVTRQLAPAGSVPVGRTGGRTAVVLSMGFTAVVEQDTATEDEEGAAFGSPGVTAPLPRPFQAGDFLPEGETMGVYLERLVRRYSLTAHHLRLYSVELFLGDESQSFTFYTAGLSDGEGEWDGFRAELKRLGIADRPAVRWVDFEHAGSDAVRTEEQSLQIHVPLKILSEEEERPIHVRSKQVNVPWIISRLADEIQKNRGHHPLKGRREFAAWLFREAANRVFWNVPWMDRDGIFIRSSAWESHIRVLIDFRPDAWDEERSTVDFQLPANADFKGKFRVLDLEEVTGASTGTPILLLVTVDKGKLRLEFTAESEKELEQGLPALLALIAALADPAHVPFLSPAIQPSSGLEERMPGWLQRVAPAAGFGSTLVDLRAAAGLDRPTAVLFHPSLVPGKNLEDQAALLAGLEEKVRAAFSWPAGVPLHLDLLQSKAGLEQAGFRVTEVLPQPGSPGRFLPEAALPLVVQQAVAAAQPTLWVDPLFYAGLEEIRLPDVLETLTRLSA